MRSSWKFPVLILGLITGLAFYLGCQREVEAGPMAPDFTLADLSGQMKTLSDYRGQVVVVDFWATWCPPCRMTIPMLIKLQEKYGKKGLVILGISLDDPQQFPDQYLLAFKEKYKINYTILRYTPKVMQDYFATERPAIPTMFVVDRKGRIRDEIVGYQPDVLEKSLDRLFK